MLHGKSIALLSLLIISCGATTNGTGGSTSVDSQNVGPTHNDEDKSQIIKLDVTAESMGDQIVFTISHSGINGMLGFLIEDLDGRRIWEISMSYDMSTQIVYGKLPTKGNMPARQEWPAQGEILPKIQGKSVAVWISFQYDKDSTPSAAKIKKVISIPGQPS